MTWVSLLNHLHIIFWFVVLGFRWFKQWVFFPFVILLHNFANKLVLEMLLLLVQWDCIVLTRLSLPLLLFWNLLFLLVLMFQSRFVCTFYLTDDVPDLLLSLNAVFQEFIRTWIWYVWLFFRWLRPFRLDFLHAFFLFLGF